MASILIVDDEEYIRDLVQEVLASEGRVFHLAADGAQALEVLEREPVDLAIVDRNMPGLSGIEVVRLIRKNPKTASVKVLICTGSSVPQEIDEAFAAGADDYALKPLNFVSLAAQVAKALGAPPRPA